MTTPNPFGPGNGSPYGPGGPAAPRTPPPTVGGAFGQTPGAVTPNSGPPGAGYHPFGGTPPVVPGGPSPFTNPIPPTVAKATGFRGRPIGVVASTGCLIVAAGLSIAEVVRTVLAIGDVRDGAQQAGDVPLDPTGVRSAITDSAVNEVSGTAIFLAVAFTVLAVGCYATFSWFIWRGAPWPRIAAIPLTVIATIFGIIGGEPIAVGIVVLCIVATACLWLPASVRFASPVDSPVRFDR